MRKLLVVFLGFFLVKLVFSQQQYYIYIQAEKPRSFYVRAGSKMFNSSGNGYLVIPGLEKNTYELIIGFPGTSESEWSFNCTLSDTDLGFILKDEGAKGVELLTLKNKQPVKGTLVKRVEQPVEKMTPTLQGTVSDDPFSSMLANVVNDQTIRQQLVIIETKQEPVAVQHSSTDDSLELMVASANVQQAPAVKEDGKPANAITPETENSVSVKSDSVKQTAEKNEPVIVKGLILKDSVKVASAPETVVEEKTDRTTVAVAEKKYEPFVVREIQHVDSANKAVSPAVTSKGGNDTSATIVKKQYEPFVVREINKKESEKAAAPPKEETTKKTNNNPEVSFLPFVVKPADTKEKVTVDTPSGFSAENKIDSAASAATESNKPDVVKEGKKPAGANAETATSSKGETAKSAASTIPTNGKKESNEKKMMLSSVKKTMERKTGDGIELIYIDDNLNGKRDTIRILIPAIK